jgi:hypothetical protein
MLADHVEPRGTLQTPPCSGMERRSSRLSNLLFGILHVQEIVVVVLGIDPDIRRYHLVRSERRNDVLDHFLLAQSQFAGARAIDLQLQGRVIEILRDVSIRHAAYLADLPGQIERGLIAGLQIRAATCTSMGAASPRFSTASTRLPEEKYDASSGSSRCMRSFTRAMYS